MESGDDLRGREDEAGNDLKSAGFRRFPSLVDICDDGGYRYIEHFSHFLIGEAPHSDRVWNIAADAFTFDFHKLAN